MLVTAAASLLLEAVHDRSRVLSGHAVGFAVFGFPITGWGADDATISWTSANVAPDLRQLADHCLLYFGQSGGTAFFYRADTHQVLRVSTMDVVVHTGPRVCKR